MDKKTVVFEIIHVNGTIVNHAYDFDKKDKMRNFYKKAYNQGLITGWAITSQL